MQEFSHIKANHSVTLTFKHDDSSAEQKITLPSDILQKILLHLPISQLLTRAAQRKRFDGDSIDPVRYVNKSFHYAVQQIMQRYPQLYKMATTEVGYNEALTRNIIKKYNVRIHDSDLPLPYSTMNQTHLYLKDVRGEIVNVGQASAHHLDNSAPIYCVNTQHDIVLYPISQTEKAFLSPLSYFTQHQASLHQGAVITVNKHLIASGDSSGCIFLWQPSSHQPITEQTNSPGNDKKIKKEKKPFLQRLSRRKNKAQDNSATLSRQPMEEKTPQSAIEADYQPRRFQEHQHPITSMVTIDNQRFMSCDNHGVIKLWHINQPQSINTWIADNHSIHKLSWSNGHCRFVSTVTLEHEAFYQISEINGDAINTVCSYLGKPLTPNSEGVLFHLDHHQLISIIGHDDDEAAMQVHWLSDNPIPSADTRAGIYSRHQGDIPFFTTRGGYGFFRPHPKRNEIEIIQPLTQTNFHDEPAVHARFP